MSRRDTIIVAALVNAGLLIILFVSALKSQDESPKIAKGSSHLLLEEALVKSSSPAADHPLDKVLQDFAAQEASNAAQVVEKQAARSSFVEELQDLSRVAQSATAQSVIESSSSTAAPFIEVKVKKGDMLEKLARQHRTSVASIMKLNNLSSSQLQIGQVLKIESVAATSGAQTKLVSSSESSVAKFYTVKSGDSPWTIAVKNHMKVEDLLKLNDLSEEKARRLRPGDQLKIR